MDISGATKAATQILTVPDLVTAAPFVSMKAQWDTQINGSYNLLYPLIHKDFPNRREIMKYISDKITKAFINHNSSHTHNGLYCTSIPDTPDMPTQVDYIKDEKLFNKYGESISTKIDPKYDVIGYGV